MDDKLLQILEDSSCLSKGQLTGYIKHTLYPEELRAVELHLSSCSLCNDALEGMEMQQDMDGLLAAMVPPVLPAHKEKPKEKKEAPVAAKTEKQDILANHAKNASTPKQESMQKNDTTNLAFRPRRSWARPMGIAAALALAFGGFWYFEFNRDNSKKQIAQQRESTPVNTSHNTAAEQPSVQSAMSNADTLLKLAEKKHADSIYVVRREEQKQKAKRDSLLALNRRGDTGKSITSESPAIAATKEALADRIDESEVAAKKPAAAPAMARAKEEAKKEPTDFELGFRKYKEKNYASALLYFKSSESDKDDPKHWEAVYYSALCNRNLNKDRKARKLFERIVEAGAPQKKSAQKQLDDMKKGD